jgi:hypothetical protein
MTTKRRRDRTGLYFGYDKAIDLELACEGKVKLSVLAPKLVDPEQQRRTKIPSHVWNHPSEGGSGISLLAGCYRILQVNNDEIGGNRARSEQHFLRGRRHK